MKLAILTHILSFMLGLASGVGLLHLVSIKSPSLPNETYTAINLVETNILETNILETNILETNRAGATKHNVEWFKDNSNYIWDGWKIK